MIESFNNYYAFLKRWLPSGRIPLQQQAESLLETVFTENEL